jgi:hypothetical protein
MKGIVVIWKISPLTKDLIVLNCIKSIDYRVPLITVKKAGTKRCRAGKRSGGDFEEVVVG